MAYLLFHYKVQCDFGLWYPFDEDPREVIAANCVAVYEDGKIISYDKNLLDQTVNEKIICENISVTCIRRSKKDAGALKRGHSAS